MLLSGSTFAGDLLLCSAKSYPYCNHGDHTLLLDLDDYGFSYIIRREFTGGSGCDYYRPYYERSNGTAVDSRFGYLVFKLKDRYGKERTSTLLMPDDMNGEFRFDGLNFTCAVHKKAKKVKQNEPELKQCYSYAAQQYYYAYYCNRH